jgi:hypothetical protein
MWSALWNRWQGQSPHVLHTDSDQNMRFTSLIVLSLGLFLQMVVLLRTLCLAWQSIRCCAAAYTLPRLAECTMLCCCVHSASRGRAYDAVLLRTLCLAWQSIRCCAAAYTLPRVAEHTMLCCCVHSASPGRVYDAITFEKACLLINKRPKIKPKTSKTPILELQNVTSDKKVTRLYHSIDQLAEGWKCLLFLGFAVTAVPCWCHYVQGSSLLPCPLEAFQYPLILGPVC